MFQNKGNIKFLFIYYLNFFFNLKNNYWQILKIIMILIITSKTEMKYVANQQSLILSKNSMQNPLKNQKTRIQLNILNIIHWININGQKYGHIEDYSVQSLIGIMQMLMIFLCKTGALVMIIHSDIFINLLLLQNKKLNQAKDGEEVLI